MRVLAGKKLNDHVSTVDHLNSTKMPSINQLNAQIELMEIWKASNVTYYPLKLNKKEIVLDNISTRACTQGKLIVPGTKPIMQKTCISDTMRLRNNAPKSITDASSIDEIKTFV